MLSHFNGGEAVEGSDLKRLRRVDTINGNIDGVRVSST